MPARVYYSLHFCNSFVYKSIASRASKSQNRISRRFAFMACFQAFRFHGAIGIVFFHFVIHSATLNSLKSLPECHQNPINNCNDFVVFVLALLFDLGTLLAALCTLLQHLLKALTRNGEEVPSNTPKQDAIARGSKKSPRSC